MNENFDIEKFLDLTGYDTPERRARRKNSEVNSNEYFTPYSIVKRMCDKIPEGDWKDPEKTFCEPSFGNGQFICYIIWNRIAHGIGWETALRTLYGVELMEDNVAESKERMLSLLEQTGVEFDRETAIKIMDHNLVCADFFEWDFRNWKPLKKKLF